MERVPTTEPWFRLATGRNSKDRQQERPWCARGFGRWDRSSYPTSSEIPRECACLKRVNLNRQQPPIRANLNHLSSIIFENWCILPQTLHQCSPLRTVPSLGRRRFSAQKALQSFPVSLLYSRFLSLAWSPRNGRICFAFHFSPCPAFFSLFSREFDFLGMFSIFRVSPSHLFVRAFCLHTLSSSFLWDGAISGVSHLPLSCLPTNLMLLLSPLVWLPWDGGLLLFHRSSSLWLMCLPFEATLGRRISFVSPLRFVFWLYPPGAGRFYCLSLVFHLRYWIRYDIIDYIYIYII